MSSGILGNAIRARFYASPSSRTGLTPRAITVVSGRFGLRPLLDTAKVLVRGVPFFPILFRLPFAPFDYVMR